MLDDKEAVQQSERYGRYREQVHRGDVVLMVTQEGDPSLHLVGFDWTAWQITRNGYL